MTSSPKKRKILPDLFWILFLALLVRLVVIYPQFSGDVKNHLVWGNSLLTDGSVGFFSRHFPGFNDANYPPATILLFGLSAFLYSAANNLVHFLNQTFGFFPSFLVPLFETENMRIAFMKLPAIFADLGIGYLIYRLSHPRGVIFSALYLFNPAVIYVSSVWGQIESVPIFFLILSFYLLPRRYFLSHAAFVLAVLSKQTALWVAPIFLILWLKEGNTQKLTKGLLFQLAVFLLIYLPFINPLGAINSYLTTLAGSSDSITDQAFNLWYFIFGWERKSDSTIFLGLTVRLWSLFLLAAAYISLSVRFFKKYSFEKAANYLFYLSLAAFFLQTRVHDRHLAPALPFLLLTTFSMMPKVALYVFLSAFHMINLYLALRLPFL